MEKQTHESLIEMTNLRSYKKLSEEPICLGDGRDPPAGLINPDYKQQPINTRKCVVCGNVHDSIIENTMTGERIEELDTCKDCFMSMRLYSPIYTATTEFGGDARCNTSDGRNINMSDELNRLEQVMYPPLPFSDDEKIFICTDMETGEIIGEHYSYNDCIKQIIDISGVNPDLFGKENGSIK